MPENGGPPIGSLDALVRRAAAGGPDRPAIVHGGRRWTWGEVDAAVDRAAAGFSAHSLESGSRVAVLLPNGVDWVVGVVGALRAGLVVVPVNTAYTDDELQYVLDDSGASLLLTDAPRPAITGVPVLTSLPDGEPSAQLPPRDPADLALLAYTSGTTGRPRGAMLTHGALLANQQQCLAMSPPPVQSEDLVLVVLPLFHVYGFNGGLGLAMATGACMYLLDGFDPVGSLQLMADEAITTVPGAPPMFQAWLAAADAAGSDVALRRAFAAVRMVSSGAAPLPVDVWTAMKERAAVTVWEGYGLTEAAPVLASTLATGRPKPACIGGPPPGIEIRLRDAAGTDHGSRVREDVFGDPFPDEAPDQGGEICARGANLFSGYWPDGADGPDDDGWLATGDIAYRDADGDLHLVDRRGDLVLVSGFNVYPGEVERVLDSHPGVAESAVIGIPDARTGEAVQAVVVRVPGVEPVTEAELLAHAALSLARFKVPRSVFFVPSLPHSLTGKVSRARLRELGLSGVQGG